MPFISYQDLQYAREREIHARIKPAFARLQAESGIVRERVNLLERAFYQNLDQSIRIDHHPIVHQLLREVQDSLVTDFEIHVFLANSPMPNACVMPRYGRRFATTPMANRAVIMLSGHFFNELTRLEQKAILGHEIGHILFGHTDLPKELVSFEEPERSPELTRFLGDLMKWSICCEVSCDMAALVAAEGDPDATATALLKFTSGLDSRGLAALELSSLVKILRDQYDEIADSVHEHELSSHPLVPLRLRVQEHAARCDLLRHFGEEFEPDDWSSLTAAFQSGIDELIKPIYADLASFEMDLRLRHVTLNLGLAVGLSDGTLTSEELAAILNLSGESEEWFSKFHDLLIARPDKGRTETSKQLHLNEACLVASELKLRRRDVLSILRSALFVAALDGHIDLSELRVIAMFAEPHGIDKEEILYMAHQITGAS